MKRIFRIFLLFSLLLYSLANIDVNGSYALEKSDEEVLSDTIQNTGNKESKILKEEIRKRTANEKHYSLEDGSFLAEIYPTDIHYVNSNGEFVDINTDLVDELDVKDNNRVSRDAFNKLSQLKTKHSSINKAIESYGRELSPFVSLETPFALELPKKFTSGYSVSKNNSSIKLIPVNASSQSKGIRDMKGKNKILYRDVWPNTDVELIVMRDGLKENIILKDEASPKKLTFELIEKVDDSIDQEIKLLPLWLVDNEGEYRDVNTSKRLVKGRTFIDLEWNSSGLVYPVVIDPTITTIRNYTNMFVSSKAPNSMHTPGVLNIGTLKSSVGSYFGYEEYFRSYLNFSLPTNTWSSASIQNGKLLAYYRTASFPAYSGVYLDVLPHHVSGNWSSSMTWNSKPNVFSDATTPSTRINLASSSNQWIEFNVTNMLKNAAANFKNNFTIALVAKDTSVLGSEVTVTLESGFMGTPPPVLHVTYMDTEAPSAPSNLRINGVSSSTASLSWDASIDNSPSSLNYEIWSGSTLLATTKNTSINLQGLTENIQYTIAVTAIDDAGLRSATSNTVSLIPGTRPFAYFTKPQPNIKNINSLNLVWKTFNPQFTDISSIQIMGSKDNWQTVGYDTGIQPYIPANSITILDLMGGRWSFKIRVSSGSDWGEWVTLNDILVTRNSVYVYDANGRLDYILIDENTKLDFTYDANGNLIKKERISG